MRPHNEVKELERILIVENSLRVGVGQGIIRIFADAGFPNVIPRIVDSGQLAETKRSFDPDVVIVDVDSLGHFAGVNVAAEIRDLDPNQVVVFASDHPNPILVKEGMIAALWSRAYWLNQPSQSPGVVLSEIRRVYKGDKSHNSEILEAPAADSRHVGLLSSQQHRVMRLMSNGYSNSAIASECSMTAKAVERTIATASRLLEVTPSSTDTNHRVKAVLHYRRIMHFDVPSETI